MDARLRAIVERASSIHERLTPDFTPVVDSAHTEIVEQRMRTWLAAVTRGDAAAFELRLGWEGLAAERARLAVGPVRLRPDAALPRWAATLAQVVGIASSNRPRERCLELDKPIPFEELLVPFVTWARGACERRAGATYAFFEASAHAALERQLLTWLSAHAARSLLLELSLEVSAPEAGLDRLLRPEPSRAGYEAFTDRMLGSGLLTFFEEYSALARVLATTTELWVEATVELLQRACADRDALRALAGEQGDLRVTGVLPSLSDPHRGLRSVATLRLSSGTRVVYKPRALGIEVAWNTLLDWLTQLGAPVSLRTFRALDRGDYGWVEHIAHAPCEDDAQARRYFERAGALLCVVYLLRGTDCHADNMVFAGEHPVIIDLETMLTPQTPELTTGAEATRLARMRLSTSVLATYLLPSWYSSPDGDEVFDGSGLGADLEQERTLTWHRWEDVNTDRMRLERGPLHGTPPARATMADGRPLLVYEHETELLRGFESMYRFLMQSRDALLRDESPFQRLGAAHVRFVHRNTSIYSAILSSLKRPDLSRDGADRSIEIEQLALAAVVGAKFDTRSGWVQLWTAERNAIERGDVPHFTTVASERSLRIAPNQQISGWFARSGQEAVVQQLAQLGEADLAFQVDLIRSALSSRAPAPAATIEAHAALPLAEPPGTDGAEAFMNEAHSIAASFARDAIRGSDGSVTWFQPAWSRQHVLEAPARELMVLGSNLYDGAVGLGLFLSALSHVTAQSDLRELALGSILPLRIELAQRAETTADELGIGGLSGLGSVVYGLVQIGRLLDEPVLLLDAERAARLITPNRIDADVALDVTLGSAGALLGLLALHHVNAQAWVLERAVRCAERLLARMEPAGPSARALRTLDGRFLTGFSHGAAGIAHALDRLHAVVDDPRLAEAARALVEFERSTFSVEHGDWPDLRHPGAPSFMLSWCHGAPGIALGRLAGLPNEDDEVSREIDRALELTQQHEPGSADHLCCGTFGIVDILATAGRQLARPALNERAQLLAAQAIARSKIRGGYALGLPSSGRLICRGLFQGLAGVGYTLLRLARPGLLPEPLLLR